MDWGKAYMSRKDSSPIHKDEHHLDSSISLHEAHLHHSLQDPTSSLHHLSENQFGGSSIVDALDVSLHKQNHLGMMDSDSEKKKKRKKKTDKSESSKSDKKKEKKKEKGSKKNNSTKHTFDHYGWPASALQLHSSMLSQDDQPEIQNLYPQQHLALQQAVAAASSEEPNTEIHSIGNPPDLSIFNTGIFALREQPSQTQRKSYKSENRCLLPNPLTIYATTKNVDILEGSASVQLVDGNGTPLPPHKSNLLESVEGTLVKPLEENLSASFSLKILNTSEGNLFRLLFEVTYTTADKGKLVEEKVLSNPFVVYSNQKKNVKTTDRPIVYDLKPRRGLANSETEVWIKGKGFDTSSSESVVVAFGKRFGHVVEVADNLITVIAPQRPDLITPTTVSVEVANKHGEHLLNAEKKLNFLYNVE